MLVVPDAQMRLRAIERFYDQRVARGFPSEERQILVASSGVIDQPFLTARCVDDVQRNARIAFSSERVALQRHGVVGLQKVDDRESRHQPLVHLHVRNAARVRRPRKTVLRSQFLGIDPIESAVQNFILYAARGKAANRELGIQTSNVQIGVLDVSDSSGTRRPLRIVHVFVDRAIQICGQVAYVEGPRFDKRDQFAVGRPLHARGGLCVFAVLRGIDDDATVSAGYVVLPQRQYGERILRRQHVKKRAPVRRPNDAVRLHSPWRNGGEDCIERQFARGRRR